MYSRESVGKTHTHKKLVKAPLGWGDQSFLCSLCVNTPLLNCVSTLCKFMTNMCRCLLGGHNWDPNWEWTNSSRCIHPARAPLCVGMCLYCTAECTQMHNTCCVFTCVHLGRKLCREKKFLRYKSIMLMFVGFKTISWGHPAPRPAVIQLAESNRSTENYSLGLTRRKGSTIEKKGLFHPISLLKPFSYTWWIIEMKKKMLQTQSNLLFHSVFILRRKTWSSKCHPPGSQI